jgi:predicted nucleotidyltransferase
MTEARRTVDAMADAPMQVRSMPIPELDENGFLPVGIHEATLEEVRERFGRFQTTDRRPTLFANLSLFMAEARASGLVEAVIVDGSFVTAKDEPSDIDLILVLRPDHDERAELRPYEYNALSGRRVRRRFRFDVVLAREGSDVYERAVSFFQGVRGRLGLRKGVVRVIP